MAQSPVDEAPGKQGYQGQAHKDEKFPVPDYAPGANPPGTNPPAPPKVDPATVPVPGSVPTFGQGETPPADADAPPPPPPSDAKAKEQHEANAQAQQANMQSQAQAGSQRHPHR